MRKTARREFVRFVAGVASVVVPRSAFSAEPENLVDLAGELGIVSASAGSQLAGRAVGRNFSLLELPRVMRDELDLRVVDLNTMSIPNFSKVTDAYLDSLRSAAADAGCLLTNLKLNQKGFDMNSRDADVRRRAIDEYKRSIDVAARLGCRWARPLPASEKPPMEIHVASYQELCDYAAEKNVQMLVENFGWMQADPNSVTRLVKAIGKNVAPGVDTGNWDSNEVRYAGLDNTFPTAVTCDFKARKLGPHGEHPAYDLRRCFDIAWNAGFHGPWCFEHANKDTDAFFREIGMLRDMIRTWTKEASSVKQ